MGRSALLAVVLFAFGKVVHAGVPSDDAFLPIVARAVGAAGRQYFTTVVVTNGRADGARVTLSFFAAGHAVPVPRTTSFSVPPHGSVTVEVDRHVMGRDEGSGSLRIESTIPVAAVARIYSRAADEGPARVIGASFEAVPSSSAIGHGESTVVPGLSLPDGAFKLYLAETTHQPLHFDLEVIDAGGRSVVTRRMFLGANAVRTIDLEPELALPRTLRGSVRLRVVNGSGRIVAVGELLALESRDSTPFSMTLPPRPRHTMPRAEALLYGAAILLVAGVAVMRRRPAAA